MTTEVKNPEVQQLISNYHASMHATIGAVVVVDSDNGNIFIGENDSRDHMKYDDGAYDGFENDVDMDESVD